MQSSISKCTSEATEATDSVPSKFLRVGSFPTLFGKRDIESLPTSSTMQTMGSMPRYSGPTSPASSSASYLRTVDSLPEALSGFQTIEKTKAQCIKNIHELADITHLVSIQPAKKGELINRVAEILSTAPEGEDSSPLHRAMHRMATAVRVLLEADKSLSPINEASSSLHRTISRMPSGVSTVAQEEPLTTTEEPLLGFTVLNEEEKNIRAEQLSFFRELAETD